MRANGELCRVYRDISLQRLNHEKYEESNDDRSVGYDNYHTQLLLQRKCEE